jgi:hypothetical protein
VPFTPPTQKSAVLCTQPSAGERERHTKKAELELELIQTRMIQKPLLWVEVGAHAVRKRSECAGVVWAGAGVAWRLCVCCL